MVCVCVCVCVRGKDWSIKISCQEFPMKMFFMRPQVELLHSDIFWDDVEWNVRVFAFDALK